MGLTSMHRQVNTARKSPSHKWGEDRGRKVRTAECGVRPTTHSRAGESDFQLNFEPDGGELNKYTVSPCTLQALLYNTTVLRLCRLYRSRACRAEAFCGG